MRFEFIADGTDLARPTPLASARGRLTVTADALFSASAIGARAATLAVVTKRAAIGTALRLLTIAPLFLLAWLSGVRSGLVLGGSRAVLLVEIGSALILCEAAAVLLSAIWPVGVLATWCIRLIDICPAVCAQILPAGIWIRPGILKLGLVVLRSKVRRGHIPVAAIIEIVGAIIVGVHVVPVHVVSIDVVRTDVVPVNVVHIYVVAVDVVDVHVVPIVVVVPIYERR